jgi:benzil reductase ((S)-benzoin forming)
MPLYIVTGASRGLGWGLVQCLEKNAPAATLAISRSGLPRPALRSEDLRCDLSSPDGQRRAAAALARKLRAQTWGKAVLINNAGMVEPVGALEHCEPRELARSLGVNLVAPIVLMQAFLAASQHILERTIINISSGAARHPYFGWAAYCAGKAGLDMASRVVALEATNSGRPLRVVSLAPGVMDTAMQDEVRRKSADRFPDVERFRQLKARGELTRPEEVAARILSLEQAGALPEGLADLRDL